MTINLSIMPQGVCKFVQDKGMNMLEKVQVVARRTSVGVGGALALFMVSLASAQTGDWDISGAQTTQTALLGAGALLVIGLVIFKLAKRASNKI